MPDHVAVQAEHAEHGDAGKRTHHERRPERGDVLRDLTEAQENGEVEDSGQRDQAAADRTEAAVASNRTATRLETPDSSMVTP